MSVNGHDMQVNIKKYFFLVSIIFIVFKIIYYITNNNHFCPVIWNQ